MFMGCASAQETTQNWHAEEPCKTVQQTQYSGRVATGSDGETSKAAAGHVPPGRRTLFLRPPLPIGLKAPACTRPFQ
jgi:hypothetical protein